VNALLSIYPDFEWDISKFDKVPKDVWNHYEGIDKFLPHLCERLQLSNLDDWYRISR